MFFLTLLKVIFNNGAKVVEIIENVIEEFSKIKTSENDEIIDEAQKLKDVITKGEKVE